MISAKLLRDISLAGLAAGLGLYIISCNSTSSPNQNGGGKAPVLSYSPAAVVDTVGKSATHAATLTGDAPTNCAATPALPAGLSISATTCTITGTPSVVSAASDFSIVAANATGADTAILNISIMAPIDTTIDTTGGGVSSLLGDKNGFAVTLNGHTWKFTDAQVYRPLPSVAARELDVKNLLTSPTTLTDMTTFNGVVFLGASIFVKPTGVGTQLCSAGDSISIQANSLSGPSDWTGNFGTTACLIQIDYMSASGGMAGKVVSATLTNPAGKVITLANAPFRVYHHRGHAGTAPVMGMDSAWNVSMHIDSGTFELPVDQYFLMKKPITGGYGVSPDDGSRIFDSAQASDAITFHWNNVPGQAGSWACGQTFSGGITNLEVWLGTYQFEYSYIYRLNGNNYGTCSITVDGQRNGAIHATYQASLANPETANSALLTLPQRTLKISGEFKNFKLGSPIMAGSGGNEGALAAGALGGTLQVTNGSYLFPTNQQYKPDTSTAPQLSAGSKAFNMFLKQNSASSGPYFLTFTNVPNAVSATPYTCGTQVPGAAAGYLTTMSLKAAPSSAAGVRFDGYGTNEAPGSSCSITVTSCGAAGIEGTYTATLMAEGAKTLLPDQDTSMTVSGSFRVKGLP